MRPTSYYASTAARNDEIVPILSALYSNLYAVITSLSRPCPENGFVSARWKAILNSASIYWFPDTVISLGVAGEWIALPLPYCVAIWEMEHFGPEVVKTICRYIQSGAMSVETLLERLDGLQTVWALQPEAATGVLTEVFVDMFFQQFS